MAKLELTAEGARALRDFADKMPIAVENIVTATEALQRTYSANQEQMGVHSEDYSNMIALVKKSMDDAKEAIAELPQKLKAVATKIDEYVADRAGIDK